MSWRRLAPSCARNPGRIKRNRGEKTVVTGSSEIDEIYHRMAVIRRDPHTNVRESVAGAEAVMDWGMYTWTYPWIAVGVAAAVGYLIYTSSHQTATARTASLAGGFDGDEPVAGVRAKGQERWRIGRNLLLAAGGIVFPVAVRAGQNYMLHWLEQQYPTRTVDRAALSPSGGERAERMGRVES